MSTNSFVSRIKPEHMTSFGDAIFAFAITLMALSIEIPDLPPNLTEPELMARLGETYIGLESYLISFAIIAVFWISYHQIFNFIIGSHMTIVYLNLLFLLFITLLSISTSLIINYGTYQIPFIIYSIVVGLSSSLLAVIWGYATKGYRLIDKNINPSFIKGSMINLISIPIVFVISIFISFVDLNIAQYFWLIIVPVNITIKRKYRRELVE
jgi:uncharacterized membrane protein